jgi:phage shock protein PspC (stress-responsive transcriptional regulator)
MTEQTQTTPEPAAGPKRFLRSREDRWLGGVAGGLGRYFGVDPILIRIAAVALALVGGLAFFVYPAMWLLIPTDDGTGKPTGPAPLMRWLGGPDGKIKAGRVVAIVAGIVAAGFALSAMVVGAVWATGSGGGVWVAVAVIALGVAAVAGALAGRRRAAWLLVPAALVAIPAGMVAAADVRFDGGWGDRHYRPATASAVPAGGYRLAGGSLRIDLRDMRFTPGTTVELPVRIGMGAATIIVPPSVCVQADSKIGAGYVNVLGDEQGGLDIRRALDGARGSAPRLHLRTDVGMGAVEVVNRPQDAMFDDHGASHTRHTLDNAACVGAA